MYTCAYVTPSSTATQPAYYSSAPVPYYSVGADPMMGSYSSPAPPAYDYTNVPPPSPPKGYGRDSYYTREDPYQSHPPPPPNARSGYGHYDSCYSTEQPPPNPYAPQPQYAHVPSGPQYPPARTYEAARPPMDMAESPVYHVEDGSYRREHPSFGQLSPPAPQRPQRRARPDVIPALRPRPVKVPTGKSEFELEAKPRRGYSPGRSFSPSRGPGLSKSQLKAKEKQLQGSPNAKSEMAMTAVTMKSDWSKHSVSKPKSMETRQGLDNNFLTAVVAPRSQKGTSMVSGGGGAMTILDDDGRSIRFVKPDQDDEGALLLKNTRIDPPPPGPPLPPSEPLPCALVDAVLMLRISDQNKLPTNRRTLDMIMCGAALMQLVMMNKVEAHPNTIRYPAELKLRAIDTRSADDQYADEIMHRLANNRTRTVAELMDYMYHQFEGLTSKVVNRLVCMGWLHYEPYSQGNPEKYYVINTKLHSILRNRVVNLMNVRDENGQAPLTDSILAAMYWMPRDFTDYAFGGTLEGYEGSQISKAILYQVRNFLDTPTPAPH